ncbi:hypothetical protein [Vibrio metschnikovii]|uniref:hypothetical protein n=1 Tax=Vibrio metschnikovii TaxID=28172 RepID=UPI001C311108|nr:hypothetical protein [Vibrio metschnikovii]
MFKDNSAARLLAILEQAKSLNPETNSQSAWMRIFELKGNTPLVESILLSKLGKVMLLPDEVKKNIEQYYPEHVDALSHTLRQIQIAFMNQNLDDKWGKFIQNIDQHCISTLSMTAALLESKFRTKLIDESKLNVFRDKVRSLLDDIIHSDLSIEFIQFITQYLQKILSSIDNYLISGAMPILEAVESTLGHAVLDLKFRDELKNTETGSKIQCTLADLADIVTVATGALGAAAHLASHGLALLGS